MVFAKNGHIQAKKSKNVNFSEFTLIRQTYLLHLPPIFNSNPKRHLVADNIVMFTNIYVTENILAFFGVSSLSRR